MKLPVFICEDDNLVLTNYDRMIRNSILINEYDMEVVLATTSIKDILAYIDKNEIVNGLFFLDIDLGSDLNGIDVAARIREKNDLAQIVFVTSHKDYAFETLKRRIAALDFIEKGGEEKEQFDEILEQRNLRLTLGNKQTNKLLKFFIGKRQFNVDLSKIYFIESSTTPHKVCLYGKDFMYEFYAKINDLDKEYPDLIRIHKSYLINPENIQNIDFKKRMIYFPEDHVCTYPTVKTKLIKNLNI